MNRLLALLLFVPSLCLAQLPDYVPSENINVWYSFDASFGNGAGSGFDGVNHGASFTTDRHGGDNGAAYFSGSDWIDLGDLPSPASFSITAWVKPNIDASMTWGNVFSDFQPSSGGMALLMSGESASYGHQVYGHTSANPDNGVCFSGSAIPEDEWSHLAMIRNSAGLTSMYINGVLQAECSLGEPIDNATSCFIGRAAHGTSENWKGAIDDFGFWSQALTHQEVQSLYHGPSPLPNCLPNEGLVAWYPLNGTGEDMSELSNHLDMDGTAPTTDRWSTGGGAAAFDGSATMSNLSFDGIGVNESHTVAFWEKHPADEAGVILCQRTGPNTTGNKLHYGYRGANDGPCIDGGCMGMDFYSVQHFTPFTAELETWNHWTLTYNGTTLNSQIFLNGTLVSEEPMAQPWTGSFDEGIVLGAFAQTDDDQSHFIGVMDDFGIWNRILEPEEIAQLYSAPAPHPGCTDPTACNYDAEATVDDGSCLLDGGLDLEECLGVTEAGELVFTVPASLSSFAWEDGSSSPSRPIGVGGEFILTATVGDLPSYGAPLGDGLVFHIDTANQEAYVATPTQVGEGAQFGCQFTVTGAWGTEMGDGLANSEAILDACADPTIAAAVASNVGPGWFLPSKAELDAIRTHLHEAGFGSYFTDNTHNWYWPSTECEASPADAAGSMHFVDGFYAACNNKDSNPGGVIAAKRIPLDLCFVSDTLFIASPCTSATLEPACGEGTVWDPVNEECIVAIPTDTDFDGCVTAGDVLNLLATFGTCPPDPEWPEEPADSTWACGDIVTYWDYDYATVLIGDQCWFAENLRTASYLNGDDIPEPSNQDEWATLLLGMTTVYGSDDHTCYSAWNFDACDDSLALEEFGRLYNWWAVDDSRGLCPAEWHVASNQEWFDLENHAAQIGFNGTEATALQSTSGWGVTGNGTDDFGFAAKPGGHCDFGGTYFYAGNRGKWWTSTYENGNGRYWYSTHMDPEIHSAVDTPKYGFSVRCVKD